MWIADIHNVLHLHHQLRIRRQPLFDLAAVEVFLGKVYIVGHALGEFLGRIGYQVLGGIVGDVQVLDNLVFIRRNILPVQGLFYLFPGPALGRVPDEQAAANPGERLRHIGGDGQAAFHLVKSKLLLGHERALPHPKGEDGHAQRIKIGLGSELNVGFVQDGDGVRIHLRGGINGGTELLGGTFAVLVQEVRDAKVAQDGGHFLPVFNKDVGGLYIFVQDTGRMQFIQGHGRVEDNRKNPFCIAFEAGLGHISLRVVGHEFIILGILHQLHRIALWKALNGRQHGLVGLEARVKAFEGIVPPAICHQVQDAFGAIVDYLFYGKAATARLNGFTGRIRRGAAQRRHSAFRAGRRGRLLDGSGLLRCRSRLLRCCSRFLQVVQIHHTLLPFIDFLLYPGDAEFCAFRALFHHLHGVTGDPMAAEFRNAAL